MPRKDNDGREFRLRPRKPPIRQERQSGSGRPFAFRLLMKYARMSRTGARKFLAPARPSYYQNCAVRVTYISSRVKGHWRAHGRYLSRESASLEPEKAGFGPVQDKLDIASTVHEWQSKSDPRLWKLILSPEFGDRVDLQKLTRKVMTEVEADLNTALEWVAVAHFNTDHPHVHIALRGIDKKGLEFKLPRDYVKSGLRAVAQHAVTAQLGYRTEQDAVLAYQQQIPEQRLTPLDRIILQRMESAPLEDAVARISVIPGSLGSTRSWRHTRAFGGIATANTECDGLGPTSRTAAVGCSPRFRVGAASNAACRRSPENSHGPRSAPLRSAAATKRAEVAGHQIA